MKKSNIDKKAIGNALKQGCSFAVCMAALILPHINQKNISNMKCYIGKANYGDAVNAIVGSDMMGSYKNEALELLKKECTTDYYSSVIQIVNSNMMGSYKVDAIRKINAE